eukprot:1651846-Prymnesium_polylepis.1
MRPPTTIAPVATQTVPRSPATRAARAPQRAIRAALPTRRPQCRWCGESRDGRGRPTRRARVRVPPPRARANHTPRPTRRAPRAPVRAVRATRAASRR